MPRRRIPNTPLPRRLDRRRPGGNATGAQRRRRGGRGQVETIAARRVVALRLRRTGASYREIAVQLAVDVATAYSDVRAELAALREQTVEEAKELRDLELQRFDEMTAGLWPQVRAGSPAHVTAAVRVSERRARLFGLDAPVVTKSELSASLSVTAERLAAERELFGKLDVQQLEELAADSEALIAKARAMAERQYVRPAEAPLAGSPVEDGDASDARGPKYTATDVARPGDGDRTLNPHRAQARTVPVLVALPTAAVDDVATGGPAEQLPAVTDQRDPAGAEIAPPSAP
jgi:DNA-binding CsgD family transcriptional regulator